MLFSAAEDARALFREMAAGEDDMELPDAATMQEQMAGRGMRVTEASVSAAYAALGIAAGERLAIDAFVHLHDALRPCDPAGEVLESDKEIIAGIAARSEQGSCPEVLPDELGDSGLQREAQQTLSFAEKTEAVVIQSHVEAAYQRHRESMPEAASADPEPLIRARWVRENYYKLMREIVHTFQPEVAIDQIPEEERERCAKLVAQVTAADEVAVQQHVAEAWGQLREQLAPFTSEGMLASVRKDFLKQKYYSIIDGVISARREAEIRSAFVFQPIVPPSKAGGAHEQVSATQLVTQVQAVDVAGIEGAVEKGWTAVVASMPNFLHSMMIEGGVRDEFLQQRYYPIVADVVAAREAEEARATFVFAPQLVAAAAGDAEQQARASSLVSAVRAEDVDHINAAVEEEWSKMLSAIPGFLRESFMKDGAADARLAFLQRRYYDILSEVLEARRHSASADSSGISLGTERAGPEGMLEAWDGRAGKGSGCGAGSSHEHPAAPLEPGRALSAATGEAGQAPVGSPFKRRAGLRRAESRGESTPAVETWASEAHCGPSGSQARRNLEGQLVWMPEQLKMVPFKDRRTQQAEDLPVLPLLISDSTGPIGVELWRDAAAYHFDILKAACAGAGEVTIRVENVIARDVKIRSIVPMKKLHSTLSTIVRVMPVGSLAPRSIGAPADSPKALVITDIPEIIGLHLSCARFAAWCLVAARCTSRAAAWT